MMIVVRRTPQFARWLRSLKDRRVLAKITLRIDSLAGGHAGDVKPIGEGVSELRIDYGPGYRIYYARRGSVVLMLLVGGDKSSQSRDIAAAKKLAREWKESEP